NPRQRWNAHWLAASAARRRPRRRREARNEFDALSAPGARRRRLSRRSRGAYLAHGQEKAEVMTDEKPDKKKRERRPVGQRETVIANKRYRLRVYLGKDAAGKRRIHNETYDGTANQADERIREIKRRHKSGEAIKPSADTFSMFLDE